MMYKTFLPLLVILCNLLPVSGSEPVKRAFLVACGDQHEDKRLNLPKAVEDVEKFRQSLLRTGFKAEDVTFMQGKAGVDLKYQPLRDAIMKQLELTVKGLNEGDTLVVALNGHGIHPKGSKTSYFVPLNGEIDKEKTLIPMDGEISVYGMLKEAQKKKARVLLIVGACRNDIRGNIQALNQMDLEDPDVPPEGIAAIYSCGVGQKTYFDEKGGSYFYEHLSKAWSGEYFSDKEKVTLEMVFADVKEKTTQEVRKSLGGIQKPEIRREYKGEWLISENNHWVIESWKKYKQLISKVRYGKSKEYLEKEGASKINSWRNAALKGIPEGMLLYANCFKEGIYETKNLEEAFHWFQKCALLENPDGMSWLGRCYYIGEGVAKDEKEAFKWFTKSAKLGDANGMSGLGNCYYYGKGVAKNEKEAFKWFTKLAELGDANGVSWLGRCYCNGEGVAKDEKEAFKWFTKSAKLGDFSGMSWLGSCYFNGKGVAEDKKEAINWWRKSSDLGNSFSMYNLGLCYLEGDGIAKDEKMAIYWYRKAASKGNLSAKKELSQLGYSE